MHSIAGRMCPRETRPSTAFTPIINVKDLKAVPKANDQALILAHIAV